MKRLTWLLGVLLIWAASAQADEYWQQRTHYTIDAEFLPDSDLIVGTSVLRYWNQSPHTLKDVYFYLYNNAWQPGSYLDRRYREFGYWSIAGADSADWGGMDIETLAIAGETVELTAANVDNTVLHLPLATPLAPGDSVDFSMQFRCKIPGAQWRNGRRGKHFDIAQWYPRICVYDRKGWHTEQKLSTGEFYGDFGDYDVTLKAPKEYLIAHTGLLVNEAELFPGLPQGSPDTVLTDILAEPEDTSQAEDSSAVEAGIDSTDVDAVEAQETVPADSAGEEEPATRTWVMHAERVIDFAMGADPTFIWDRTRTKDGVLIDCYYTPQIKKDWAKNGAAFTKYVIELYSEKFGQYPYPRYSLVSSSFRGGVEYPQLTFVSGRATHIPSHGLFDVTAHEVAHCWFYGILATNEIAEAFLDEGFTEFATSVAIENYFGRWNNGYTFETHMDSLFSDADDERSAMQRRYIQMQSRMDDVPPLATSSEHWPGFWVYGTMVYRKTATVLYALMDVLGEDTFWKCMQHYYDQWSFKHPQREDMYQAFNECSGQNLDWFWEQWFEENWTLDLSLDDVAFADTDSGYAANLTVSRHGEAMAPVTARFDYDDGTYVDRRLDMRPWRGGLSKFTYHVSLPEKPTTKVKRVTLDPDLYTPDLDRTNNYSGMMPLEARFMPPAIVYPNQRLSAPLDRQRIEHQPRLWYNEYDGIELGYYAGTSWIDLGHRWDGLLMVGTESGKIDWWIGHSEIWESLSRKAEWSIQQRRRDGRWDAELSGTFSLARYYWERHDIKVAYRIGDAHNYVNEYVHAQMPWERGLWSEFEFQYRRPIERRYHSHNLAATLRTSGVGSEFDYQQGEFELTSDWELPNVPDFESRLYVSLMGGTPPLQRRPALATASPLAYFEDPYFRAAGTLPARGINEGHIFKPGGGHLLGYLSDTFTAPDNMATVSVFRETNLLRHVVPQGVLFVSRNLKAIRLGVFADGGAIWNNNQSLKDATWLSDAGPVLSYRVPYQWFERLFGDKPIRAYFPLWVSDPITGDRFDFRWQLAFTGSW